MKSLFASKTFWANIVSVVAMIATASGSPHAVLMSDPIVQQQAIGFATTAVNIGLRLITKESVSVLRFK
jgi:hypothetical protein